MSSIVYYVQTNVLCILVVLILLLSFTHYSKKTAQNDLFRWMLISIILFCASDIAAGALRGQTFPGANVLIWISNIFYNVTLLSLGFFWVLFSMFVLTGKIYRSVAIIAGLCGLAVIGLNVTTPWTGWMFTVNSENLYERGPLVWLDWCYTIPCSVLPAICCIWVKVETRKRLAVALYPIAPLAASIVQLIFYGVSAGQVGATVSAVLVFVMLETNEVNAQMTKAKVYDELANTDALTGINNRRAYESRLAKEAKRPWAGAVFFDINGLKETNDTQGHAAGDELIVSVAEFLKRFFPTADLYRISGDEFVAFTEDEETFRFKLSEIKRSNTGFVAFGQSEGEGKDVIHTVQSAEAEMYKDKAAYYERSGKNRRRQ